MTFILRSALWFMPTLLPDPGAATQRLKGRGCAAWRRPNDIMKDTAKVFLPHHAQLMVFEHSGGQSLRHDLTQNLIYFFESSTAR